MGFGAAVQGMLTSLKNNKRARKSRFDNKEPYQPGAYGEFVDHKKFTPSQMKAFKERIKTEKKVLFRKQLSIFAVIFSMIFGLFYYLMFVM